MKVVILGGGFCGATVAKKLDKINGIETVLIDKKSFFEFSPSLHKVIFRPSYIYKLRVPYSSFLKNKKIIADTALQVTPTYLKTTKHRIDFDILVISTGIDYPIFLDNTENVFVIKKGQDALRIAKTIRNTNRILIVGGGVIGAEIAGEIVTKMPHKHLTIVHPHDRMLERNPNDASMYTHRFLKKQGAEIIFGEKVVDHKDGAFITNKNRVIKADLCVWCAGIKSNTDFMNDFPATCFTRRNALKVNEFLQLEHHLNIFVGGDINGIQEEKTARKAELHARIIVKNIIRLLQDKPLVPYKTGTSPMVISLGDWSGIIQYRFVIPGLFVPGIVKWLIQWWVLRQFK